ncbi:MAG: hypothetical protein ABSE89_01335 [Sedimentisphaerales bacterium]
MKNYYRNKGFALAGAIMFLLLVMIMWIGVTRQLGTNLDIEEHIQNQKAYYDGCGKAISWGLTLCETGYPYTGTASKSYWVQIDSQKYVIVYDRIQPYLEIISHFPFFRVVYNYEVTARPYVTGSDDSIRAAPNSFGT